MNNGSGRCYVRLYLHEELRALAEKFFCEDSQPGRFSANLYCTVGSLSLIIELHQKSQVTSKLHLACSTQQRLFFINTTYRLDTILLQRTVRQLMSLESKKANNESLSFYSRFMYKALKNGVNLRITTWFKCPVAQPDLHDKTKGLFRRTCLSTQFAGSTNVPNSVSRITQTSLWNTLAGK